MTTPAPLPDKPNDQPLETGERRFVPPWWTIFFPLLAALGVGAWYAGSAEGDRLSAFLDGLLWPGSGAFAAVALMVWLGWVLDLE